MIQYSEGIKIGKHNLTVTLTFAGNKVCIAASVGTAKKHLDVIFKPDSNMDIASSAAIKLFPSKGYITHFTFQMNSHVNRKIIRILLMGRSAILILKSFIKKKM